jgi:hypothetical protein
MKALLPVILLVAFGGALRAQTIDSTALLFDDSYVHEFNITFYYDNYEDSLKYWYENGEECIPARVEYQGMVFDSVGVRYKGNSSYNMSRNTPKKPLKFEFDEFYSKQECFDAKTLNFSNAAKDPTFLREKICYDILKTHMKAPRAAFAAISINGELLGLYTMVEQVDKRFLARHFPEAKQNLYKAHDNGATLLYRGDAGDAYKTEFELKTNEEEDDWSRFIMMVRLLNNVPDAEFRSQLGTWIEFESAIQLLAFNMVMSNFDSYTGSGRNFYIYDDGTTGQFTLIPWDINEGFGSYTNNWNVFTQNVLTIGNLAQRPLNRRILADDLLRARYLRAIRALVDGAAGEDSVAAAIARWKPLIEPWVQADRHKLYTYQQFLDNMDRDVVVGINMPVPGLTRFSATRNENLRQQLLNYASMSSETAPESMTLTAWNYPNPAASHTTVAYALPAGGDVTFVLFDALGRVLRRSSLGAQAPGMHAFDLDGLTPGTFFYQLTVSGAAGAAQRSNGRFAVLR